MHRISTKRRERNCLNAAKSTGPHDTAQTRLNALKHGLLSEGITEFDDSSRFRKLCRNLTREYQPAGTWSCS